MRNKALPGIKKLIDKSPLKHPAHKDHHKPLTKKDVKKGSSPGWPKLPPK